MSKLYTIIETEEGYGLVLDAADALVFEHKSKPLVEVIADDIVDELEGARMDCAFYSHVDDIIEYHLRSEKQWS